MIERRSFITGLIALVTAPAIVRAGSLMPVKQMIEVPRVKGIETGLSILSGGSLQLGDIITFNGMVNLQVREFVVIGIAQNGERYLQPA